jgi:CPA2 family monovalent cation:H+ antiporter-2
VTCAVVSIAANPLFFRSIDPLERWLRSNERIWRILNQPAWRKGAELNAQEQVRPSAQNKEPGARAKAIIVGYGPVGQIASRILRDFDIPLVIVDMNLDTIQTLTESAQAAIYGDASRRAILEAAGIRGARYLLVTIPDALTRTAVILAAKELNPELHVFARAPGTLRNVAGWKKSGLRTFASRKQKPPSDWPFSFCVWWGRTEIGSRKRS